MKNLMIIMIIFIINENKLLIFKILLCQFFSLKILIKNINRIKNN